MTQNLGKPDFLMNEKGHDSLYFGFWRRLAALPAWAVSVAAWGEAWEAES